MSDDQKQVPVSGKTLMAFVGYFALMLPAIATGLWWVIDSGTTGEGGKLELGSSQLFLAVILAGALGSYIHAVNSFVSYVGNRRFYNSWIAFYVLRPFMGVAMALVFYVVVRGGVLVLSGGNGAVDPYGMMTVAALAGMFSKQASDKLAEVFDTLFRSRADEGRKDKLENPAPRLAAVEPRSVVVGTATEVKLVGEGFVPESDVRVGAQTLDATYVSARELRLSLTADSLKTPGTLTVAVLNPAPGGGLSNALPFAVEERRLQDGAADDRQASGTQTTATETQTDATGTTAVQTSETQPAGVGADGENEI